jgi:2-methylisocitrate lyase-like PEP mutase family enzyme
MSQYERFFQLHHGNQPLLIGNVWDATSAKVFERNGFKAVATSSAALARTMGYEDGENIPFELLLKIIERIIRSVSIPLSVDMEAGYGKEIPDILQNLERLHELGVVGFNIEDSSRGEQPKLRSMDEFQKIIAAIKNHLDKKSMNMFINARTDTYLVEMPSPLAETIKRIKAYEHAGATGIFVPFISDKQEIKDVVESTQLPLNVLCMQSLPTFDELSLLGVKRVSMGSAPHNFLTALLEKTIKTIQEDGNFKSLY